MGVGAILRSCIRAKKNVFLFVCDSAVIVCCIAMLVFSIVNASIFGGQLTYIAFDSLAICAAIIVLLCNQALFYTNVASLKKSMVFGIILSGWFFLVVFLQIVIFIQHITLFFTSWDWSTFTNDLYICVIIAWITMGVWYMYTDCLIKTDQPEKTIPWLNIVVSVTCAVSIIIWLSVMFGVEYIGIVSYNGVYWAELLQNIQYIFVAIGAIMFCVTSRFIWINAKTKLFWAAIAMFVVFGLSAFVAVVMNITAVVLTLKLIVIERVLFLSAIGGFYVGGRFVYAIVFAPKPVEFHLNESNDFDNHEIEVVNGKVITVGSL